MQSGNEFLATKVTPVLEPMMVDLLMNKPEDPVAYMIKYLTELKVEEENMEGNFQNRYLDKDMSEERRILVDVYNVQRTGSEVEQISEEEDEVRSVEDIKKKKTTFARKGISAESYGEWNKKSDFVARVIPKTEEQIHR